MNSRLRLWAEFRTLAKALKSAERGTRAVSQKWLFNNPPVMPLREQWCAGRFRVAYQTTLAAIDAIRNIRDEILIQSFTN
jgi:hypothetical protein